MAERITSIHVTRTSDMTAIDPTPYIQAHTAYPASPPTTQGTEITKEL